MLTCDAEKLYVRFGAFDKAGASDKVGTTGKVGTADRGVSPDQGVTPEQEHFRAEVQAAMDTLNKDELGLSKPLKAVAEILHLRVPPIPETPAPAPAPVGTGWGGQQMPPTQ